MKNGDFLAHEGMRIRGLLKYVAGVAGCSTKKHNLTYFIGGLDVIIILAGNVTT